MVSLTTWGIGDYPAMARRLEPVAESVTEAAAIEAGDRVLDVATGTGNAALLAAQRGARVTAVDFEPTLLRLARQRATAAGLPVTWTVGDVGALPVPDGCVDTVLSVFGVMYAPDHDGAARELARVCVPGGRLVLAAWTPGSFLPAMGQVLAEHLPPPPPASGPPSRWGDPEALVALLGDAGLRLTTACTRELELTFADADAAVTFLIGTAGHVLAERQRLIAEGRWDNLLTDLRRFVDERGSTRDGAFALPLTHLLATAVRLPHAGRR
ncbi:class I SAM-dependent methyltransferase [Micromonospora sp. FIMYZ51]|uniref:class I SAM-dependent methyltransferase n=1 Tax=Micromonospora sp. FIMYZ51 TaxID=3051832 RepID=UPI00311FFE72